MDADFTYKWFKSLSPSPPFSSCMNQSIWQVSMSSSLPTHSYCCVFVITWRERNREREEGFTPCEKHKPNGCVSFFLCQRREEKNGYLWRRWGEFELENPFLDLKLAETGWKWPSLTGKAEIFSQTWSFWQIWSLKLRVSARIQLKFGD